MLLAGLLPTAGHLSMQTGAVIQRHLIKYMLLTCVDTSDPTGYGWHGDFQNGWDTQALQTAIDKCNDPSNDTINGVIDACQYLTLQTADTAKTCKATPERAETIDGKLAKLPG